MKCLVSENEGDYQAAGEDKTCTNFKGSLNAVSVFQIEATPKNHFYPFDGLRTMNEAKAFCESQGGPFSGPGTKFGLDDDNAQTEGNNFTQCIICLLGILHFQNMRSHYFGLIQGVNYISSL